MHNTNKKIIDISLDLSNSTIVYPGNVPITLDNHTLMPEHSSHLSKIVMGSHSGTHIDAPLHAMIGGSTIDELPLDIFVGDCRVIDFTSSKEAITIEDLKRENIKAGERILAKTSNSSRGFKTFYDDYVYLDADAADYLADIKALCA